MTERDYDVTVCSERCGWDASFSPPEIKRCLSCNAILVTLPLSMMNDWLALGPVKPDEDE